MKLFWIILNTTKIGTATGNHITKIHEKEDDAIMEATRLCKKENEEFVVMKAVKNVFPKAQPVEIEEIH